MSLSLSTCVLFISFMKSVNGVQLLNMTLLLVLFSAAAAAAVFGTVIVPLACTYSSLL